jgi:tetratricopeptide (TPR) repeat protein/transcriptional regulator with XRE-family HTH domain
VGARPSPASDSFGTLLRRYRLAAGLSQEELAGRSGLSVRGVANMERGRTARPHRHSVQTLADALGLPEPERRQLDRASRVLGSDLDADLAPPRHGPHQLPAAVAGFTGRAAELEALSRVLADARDSSPGTVVISAIGGTAGVGKTALAVHWARRVANRFADGQLYVNLRGYDPDQPAAAADALAGFLRALGVPGHEIPDEIDERARLYRSRLAGRRVLVLLDNARDGEQVRPLLPGDPGCVAVVTSRDALAGLVAADGARRLDLDVLPLADAVGLLRSLIGSRADQEPAAVAELAGLCARLPLALRIAAELAARRAAPLAELVTELQADRLDLLDAGEHRADVRAVFSWSYRYLDADSAHAFRLVGLHPGSGCDPEAAAALIGAALKRTRMLLARLSDAHLLQYEPGGRYAMHDLMRAYARELAAAQDGEDACRAALTRLFDHYVCRAVAAVGALAPDTPRSGEEGATTPAEQVNDPVAARAWLDGHRAVLVAIAAHATQHGWPGHVTRLATALFRYLEGGGHYPELMAINEHALRAARMTGDRLAEAEALNNGTVVDLRQGRYRQAGARLDQALALYLEIGDQHGQARALGNLGIVEFLRGRYQQAFSSQHQALHLYRQIGDHRGEIRTLDNLGLIELRLGRYEQADSHFDTGIELARRNREQTSEGYLVANRGLSELRQHRHGQAARHLQRSLALLRGLNDPTGEAYALTNLGLAELGLGHRRQALEYQHQSLALARQTGDEPGEAAALNGTGEVLLTLDEPTRARDQHAEALAVARKIGDPYEQARAHRGMASSLHAAGELVAARQHWQQALAVFADLGTPEADVIRARLASTEATTENFPAPLCDTPDDPAAPRARPPRRDRQ